MSKGLINGKSMLVQVSGKGLVPTGDKPFPKPMMTQIYIALHVW